MMRSRPGDRRRRRRGVALGLAVLVVLGLGLRAAPAVPAQEPSPQEVVQTSMEMLRRGDWAAYTGLMHPDALAEAKRMFRTVVAGDTSGRAGKAFFGVDTVAQYDGLSPVAAFEALMQNLPRVVPGFAEALKTMEHTIVGAVPEGDAMVHVVYRTGAKAQGMTISRTSVATVRRHDGQWRLLLTGSLEGLAARLLQSVRPKR